MLTLEWLPNETLRYICNRRLSFVVPFYAYLISKSPNISNNKAQKKSLKKDLVGILKNRRTFRWYWFRCKSCKKSPKNLINTKVTEKWCFSQFYILLFETSFYLIIFWRTSLRHSQRIWNHHQIIGFCTNVYFLNKSFLS